MTFALAQHQTSVLSQQLIVECPGTIQLRAVGCVVQYMRRGPGLREFTVRGDVRETILWLSTWSWTACLITLLCGSMCPCMDEPSIWAARSHGQNCGPATSDLYTVLACTYFYARSSAIWPGLPLLLCWPVPLLCAYIPAHGLPLLLCA